MVSEAKKLASKKWNNTEQGKISVKNARKKYYEKNKELIIAKQKIRYHSDVEKEKARYKKHKIRRQATDKIARCKRQYKMDYDELLLMLEEQEWSCKICKKSLAAGDRLTHIDHCNTVLGEPYVRGWLCHRCNLGLGLFFDNPRLLQRAAEYVISAGNISLKDGR